MKFAQRIINVNDICVIHRIENRVFLDLLDTSSIHPNSLKEEYTTVAEAQSRFDTLESDLAAYGLILTIEKKIINPAVVVFVLQNDKNMTLTLRDKSQVTIVYNEDDLQNLEDGMQATGNGGGGGEGVTDHALLTGRSKANQHPTSAINGLDDKLIALNNDIVSNQKEIDQVNDKIDTLEEELNDKIDEIAQKDATLQIAEHNLNPQSHNDIRNNIKAVENSLDKKADLVETDNNKIGNIAIVDKDGQYQVSDTNLEKDINNSIDAINQEVGTLTTDVKELKDNTAKTNEENTFTEKNNFKDITVENIRDKVNGKVAFTTKTIDGNTQATYVGGDKIEMYAPDGASIQTAGDVSIIRGNETDGWETHTNIDSGNLEEHLPLASMIQPGAIKPDGVTTTVTDDGTLSIIQSATESYTKEEVDEKLADKATIDEVESVKTQYEVIPEASEEYEGLIIQYTGEDLDNYKNGYFYKCVKNEDDAYSWININVQPASGGSGDVAELPSDLIWASYRQLYGISENKSLPYYDRSDSSVKYAAGCTFTFPDGTVYSTPKDSKISRLVEDHIYFQFKNQQSFLETDEKYIFFQEKEPVIDTQYVTYIWYKPSEKTWRSGDTNYGWVTREITPMFKAVSKYDTSRYYELELYTTQNLNIKQMDIASEDKLGIVKPDNKTIVVAEDGTMSAKSEDEYGIKGDYATHYGIIKCQTGLIKYSLGSKQITIPAGMQLLMPGDDIKTQLMSDVNYEYKSTKNFTLFITSNGECLESSDVAYSEKEPENGQDNYVAWWNPKHKVWQFKSNDTGNVWRDAKAAPIADIYLNGNGNITRVDYIGYRVFNDQVFALKEDVVGTEIPLSETDATTIETKITELEAICNATVAYKPIEPNTDLNELAVTGLYIAQTNDIISTIKNKPEDVDMTFSLQVIFFSAIKIKQVLTTTNGKVYERLYQGGNWEVWSKASTQLEAGDNIEIEDNKISVSKKPVFDSIETTDGRLKYEDSYNYGNMLTAYAEGETVMEGNVTGMIFKHKTLGFTGSLTSSSTEVGGKKTSDVSLAANTLSGDEFCGIRCEIDEGSDTGRIFLDNQEELSTDDRTNNVASTEWVQKTIEAKSPVVSITQAEYNALENKDPTKLYNITDKRLLVNSISEANEENTFTGKFIKDNFSQTEATFVIASDQDFKDWADNKAGNDYSIVYISAGTYTLQQGSVNLDTTGTRAVIGHPDSKLVFKETTFTYGSGNNVYVPGIHRSALQYGSEYYMRNVTIDVTGTPGISYNNNPKLAVGFYNCSNMYNCIAYAHSLGNYMAGYGYYSCSNLVQCSGFGAGANNGNAYAFANSRYLVDCVADMTEFPHKYDSQADIRAFTSCQYCTSCYAKVKNGYEITNGFFGCSNLTSCFAEIIQDDSSATITEVTGFRRCNRLSSCQSTVSNNGRTPTTTGTSDFHQCCGVVNCYASTDMTKCNKCSQNFSPAYTTCYADGANAVAVADNANGGFNSALVSYPA